MDYMMYIPEDRTLPGPQISLRGMLSSKLTESTCAYSFAFLFEIHKCLAAKSSMHVWTSEINCCITESSGYEEYSCNRPRFMYQDFRQSATYRPIWGQEASHLTTKINFTCPRWENTLRTMFSVEENLIRSAGNGYFCIGENIQSCFNLFHSPRLQRPID